MRNRRSRATGIIPDMSAIVVYGISFSIGGCSLAGGRIRDCTGFFSLSVFGGFLAFIFLAFFGLLILSTLADIVCVQSISVDPL